VDILSKLKQREKQILKDTDQYNLAAEYYFKKKENDRYLREKPFVLSKSDFEVQVRFALLIDALDISIADTVLDFGAGTCWTSALLNRMGVRTISLDVSRTALKIGKEEVFQFDKRQKMELNPSFIAYNGRRIPLVDGSVDRILCFEAFHHIPNQQEILNEMYRVLRNGGKAGFSEPGEGHSLSAEAIRESEAYGVLENDIDAPDFRQKAEAAGFTGFTLKPYLTPNRVTFTLEEYLKFLEGRGNHSTKQLVSSLSPLPLIILEKSKGKVDSKHPNVLKAKIAIIEGARKAGPGEVLNIVVRVKNAGDTLWLSEPHGAPCRVALGIRMVEDRERKDFARGFLTKDLPPGNEDVIKVSFRTPDRIGRYVLEFDMVNEQVCWFIDRGSEPYRMEIEVI
jgi:SAM-dependent methyltransferase